MCLVWFITLNTHHFAFKQYCLIRTICFRLLPLSSHPEVKMPNTLTHLSKANKWHCF
ncbi:hypothetical protein [Moraxella lacunata]|uniref:hypothetical protein n=1 Tax=Moraxella lacunata TaxID=477 RepID=UPI003EE13943